MRLVGRTLNYGMGDWLSMPFSAFYDFVKDECERVSK
nr:MAG TPA_asm: hypothetical protein [Caudoviricetes sp.]